MGVFASRSGSYEENVEIVNDSPFERLGEFCVDDLDNAPISIVLHKRVDTKRSPEEEEAYPPPSFCTLEEKEKRIRYLELYQAAVNGDWQKAVDIYNVHKEDISAKISKYGDTALHIAVAAERINFVKKLVEKMNKAHLTMKNDADNTAFCLAAVSGKLELAQVMVNKMNEKVGNIDYCLAANDELATMMEEGTNLADANSTNLANIRGSAEMLPLYMAALFGQKEMVEYLYNATDDDLLYDFERIDLLITLIGTGMYDVALKLLEKHPELAFARDGNRETALHALARMNMNSSNFANPNQQGTKNRLPPQAIKLIKSLWKKATSELDDYEISELIRKPWRLIFLAAGQGNIEFLTILIQEYPDMIFKVDENKYTIFHFAVMNRHNDIFELIYKIGSNKDLLVSYKDEKGNNILHLAAKLAPPERLHIVSGAALQLQRELLWFKEVSKIVHPMDVEAKNIEGKTPRALFSEEHKELKEKGEEWMKQTANSCMIVTTLIATVVFAAAFTVPGGTKGETGSPNFLKKVSFTIFAISDAISLVLSSCSILTFLSILTSRYAEEDFINVLPRKLVVGLATLLLSIGAMMIVFCATMFIVFKDGMIWVPIVVTVIASIPVILFTEEQWRLFRDVVRSTYQSSSLFQSSKQTLFNKQEEKAREKKKEK